MDLFEPTSCHHTKFIAVLSVGMKEQTYPLSSSVCYAVNLTLFFSLVVIVMDDRIRELEKVGIFIINTLDITD